MTDVPAAAAAEPLRSSSPANRDAARCSRPWLPVAIVFVVALLSILFRTPWPRLVIADSDAGHQLAGALQIAHGEHPFADFRSTYGPLTFYVSFVGQWLSGWRIGADLLICTFAYAITYALIFVGAKWMSGNRRAIPYAVTLLAIIQLPRFYKYYILFGPACVLICLLWYLAKPNLGRMLLAAASIVVTGLYRPDMGAYAAVSGALAVALARQTWSKRVTGLCQLGGFVLLVCSPWLVFLISRHHLIDYLRDSTFGAANQAQGLSLPFPRPTTQLPWNSPTNLEAYTFLIWWSLPLVGAAILLTRGRQLDAMTRNRGVVTVAFAGLCLLQSAHRSELHHLMQSLAVSYVLAATVVSQLIDIFPSIAWRRLVSLIALALGGTSVAAGATIGSISGGSIKSVASYPRFYFCDRAEFVHRLDEKDPANEYVQLVRYIDAHTAPGDRILAVPFMPTLYYFADRQFAGGQMLVAPGYFSSDADQRRLVQTLREQGNPMIIEWTKGGAFDGMPTRELRLFAAIFYAYVREAYEPANDPQIPSDYTAWRARGRGASKDGPP
jgi:hypothetical protein